MSAKRYYPVQYGDQEGTLTISPTELAFVSDSVQETWPCHLIQRQMIKTTNDNQHLVRLILDGEPTPVILRVATRQVLEEVKAEIARVKRGRNHSRTRRTASSLSPTPNASFIDELPSHWTGSPPFANKLVPVSPKRKEYWDVLKTLRETMDGPCHLSGLSRIQNEGLWSYYQFRKNQLAKKYSSQNLQNQEDYLNERTVWHGTSSLDPAVIYEDEQDGFMMQYSQTGFWGRGIYFSERAGYSDHYAYKPNDNDDAEDRELLLVQLLIGQTIMLDREEPWQQEACQQLVAPPDNPNINNLKYDTVSGVVTDHNQATKIHVVYDNGRGYPAYLVRYYKGKRDPTKSPYKSHEDALQGKKTKDSDEELPSTPRQKSKPSNKNSVRSSTSTSVGANSFVDEEQGLPHMGNKSPGDNQQQQQKSDKKDTKVTRSSDTSQPAAPGAFAAQGRSSSAAAVHGNENNTGDQFLVQAAIVEENEGDVIVAEQMPHIWTSPRGRNIIIGLIACVIGLVGLVVVILFVWVLPKNETSSSSSNNNNRTGAFDLMDREGASNMLLNMFQNDLVPRSTINSLKNPNSPQSNAQEWLLADPNLQGYKQKRRALRFVLATFFYATDGPNWVNNTNWLDYNVDECDWYFDQNPCKRNGKMFIRIQMAWNNLRGTLVPELGVVRDLEVISLVGGLHGRIPQVLFDSTNLTELVLKRTGIKGSIPSTIEKATSLTRLELISNNRLDEELPTELGNLRNLENLALFNNSIPGRIPSEIGKLQKLALLDLGSNQIEGPVPSELGNLQRLQGLYLGSNQGLAGTLPVSLAGMTRLQKANLSLTSLTGEIPWCSNQQVSTALEGTNLYFGEGSC